MGTVMALTSEVIQMVEREAVQKAHEVMKNDFRAGLLYGSCARGDFSADSDIDIALLVNCSRLEVKQYSDKLADIAAEMAMKYYAIVNFVCIPYEEYINKKSWYLYFQNIHTEGVLIDG